MKRSTRYRLPRSPLSSRDARPFVLASAPAGTNVRNPFFAFDNGVGRDQHFPLDEQAKMLKELGYAGIGYTGTQRIPEMLKALDATG